MSDSIYAFTDGSSDYKKKLYGSGAVLLTDHSDNAIIVTEISKEGKSEALIKYNNVAGEVLACCYAIEEAISRGYKNIILYVDYIGLIHWFNGSWQARTLISQLYTKQLREYRKFINIEFVKVTAHTGSKWNEYADVLAKKSIGK